MALISHHPPLNLEDLADQKESTVVGLTEINDFFSL